MVAGQEASIKDAEAVARLKRYWAFGPGREIIQPELPGAFRRCQVAVGRYIKNPSMTDGFCARAIHDATGTWPGSHNGDHH